MYDLVSLADKVGWRPVKWNKAGSFLKLPLFYTWFL